ncbi:MAG: hypothetical protein AAB432_03290 [Patescibacteria group bacterium]
MMMPSGHWEEIFDVFRKTKSSENLVFGLTNLYEKFKKEKIIQTNLSLKKFIRLSRIKAAYNGVAKLHHKGKSGRLLYPWDSESDDCFIKTNSQKKLDGQLGILYKKWKKERKIKHKDSFRRFLETAKIYAKRKGLFKKSHKKAAAHQLWSEKEKERFREYIRLRTSGDASNDDIISAGFEGLVSRRQISSIVRDLFPTGRQPEVQKKVMSRKELERLELKRIWTPDRLKLIKECVRVGFEPERIYEALHDVPRKLVEAKVKELRGSGYRRPIGVDVFSETGFGRLTVSSEMVSKFKSAMRQASAAKPFEIIVGKADSFSIMAINAPLIGTEYSQVMEENIIRNALELAERNKDDFVLLPGGLISLDTKRTDGEFATHRALVSGLRFEEKVIDPRYRKEAAWIRKNLPANNVVFQNIRERFLNLLLGWTKIVTWKSGKPVYSGQIFITFGRLEEEIILAAAHAEIRYIVTVQRNRTMNERKGVEALLRFEKRKESPSFTLIDKLEKEKDELLAKENRTILTNVDPEDRKRFVGMVRSWVIKGLEHAIPGARVITQGTAFFRVGNTIIEVHQDREQGPTTNLLDMFLRKNAGRRALDNTLPDVELLINPYTVNYRYAMVERTKSDGTQVSTYVYQPPVALNKRFLLDQFKELVKKVTPIEKLLRHENFEPGVLRLEYRNGIWIPEPLSAQVLLRKHEEGISLREMKHESKYIYIYCDSDEHYGHPWKKYYYDVESGRRLGHDVAVKEILRRNFLYQRKSLPLHAYFNLGDQTQGHHFPTQAQPHELISSYRELEREHFLLRRSLQNGTSSKMLAKQFAEFSDRLLHEIRLQGIHWPQKQFEMYESEALEPNADFFASIIRRAEESNVRTIGISERSNSLSDSRDIGIISILGGNHFDHTVEGELTEGVFFARKIIDLLLQNPKLKLPRRVLEYLVRAPLHGNTSVGQGLLRGGSNGYEWGISLRHDPSRKSGPNGDPLMKAVSNVLERGDFPRIFTGRKVIHISGDIHRFGSSYLTDAVVMSCAAGTGNDPYGERGFSSNNIGSMVIGLPARGPKYGPIRMIVFNHDFVSAYLKAPWKINWEQIFKNPL